MKSHASVSNWSRAPLSVAPRRALGLVGERIAARGQRLQLLGGGARICAKVSCSSAVRWSIASIV